MEFCIKRRNYKNEGKMLDLIVVYINKLIHENLAFPILNVRIFDDNLLFLGFLCIEIKLV